jgi:hypothetical protein
MKLFTQIVNGTIDPSWVIAITVIIVGVLLVRILNRIEKKQEDHDEKINSHEVKLGEHDIRIQVIEKRN